MRFVFILAEKDTYPVTIMCRVLCVSTSGYYAWLQRKPSKRSERKAALTERIKATHECSRRTYGSPRVTEKLRNSGERVTEKTVAKIMRENELVARRTRRFKATTDSRHTKRIADNLLQRDFTATAKNQVWVTDVTAVWTLLGWVYLATIVDLFSRRVVSWAMSESNDTTLALAALDKALRLRKPPPGLIHHSDRGSSYGSDDYIARLDAASIVRSMSRKGDCWDNAVAESFFSTLEFECRGPHDFTDIDDARDIIGNYIDGFYNPQRMHSTIGYCSPIEFEIACALSSEAA
jgi:putative transposase